MVEKGDSVAELTKRVKKVFDGAETWRARRIAATEAARAVHAAQLQAAEDSEVVAGLEWLVSDDACPLCQKIASEARYMRLSQSFAVIGDNPHYKQIKYPPAHPSCQCAVVEVLKPEYGGPEDPPWADTLDQPRPGADYRPPGGAPKPQPGKLRNPPKPTKKPTGTPVTPPPPAPIVSPLPKVPGEPIPPKPPEHQAQPAPVKPTKKPTGTPVSKALEPPSGPLEKPIASALKAIDEVHGDGALARIPVEETDSTDELGAFRASMTRGPDRIDISRHGNHPELTFAHEVGHYLDLFAVPGGRNPKSYSWRHWDTDPLVADWKQAVEASGAFAQLKALEGVKSVQVPYLHRQITYPIDQKTVAYLTSWEEVWARSYAQYIATRSSNTTMKAELEKERDPKTYRVYYCKQWSDADFEPIAEAFDQLFEKIGWRQ